MQDIKVVNESNEQIARFEVQKGIRLVNALEDNGIDILHLCGGNAKCTTCRVEVIAGESDKYTLAEQELIQAKAAQDPQMTQPGIRLSCQCSIEQNMTVRPIMTVSNSGKESAGKRPADQITPNPMWHIGKPSRK